MAQPQRALPVRLTRHAAGSDYFLADIALTPDTPGWWLVELVLDPGWAHPPAARLRPRGPRRRAALHRVAGHRRRALPHAAAHARRHLAGGAPYQLAPGAAADTALGLMKDGVTAVLHASDGGVRPVYLGGSPVGAMPGAVFLSGAGPRDVVVVPLSFQGARG